MGVKGDVCPWNLASVDFRRVDPLTGWHTRGLNLGIPYKNETTVAPNPQPIWKVTQGLGRYSNRLPPVQTSQSRWNGVRVGELAGMAPGGCRLLAVLLLLLPPISAAAQAIPPGAQPGR